MTSDKLYKFFSIAFPATFVTTVVVVPTVVAVAENNRKPHPTPAIEFEVQVELPEGAEGTFSNIKAVTGQDYETEITIDCDIEEINITVGDNQLTLGQDYKWSKLEETNDNKYHLIIYGQALTCTNVLIDIEEEVIEYDSFTVVEDENCRFIYRLSTKTGETVELTDSEFEQLSGRFLIEQQDGSFIINEPNTSIEQYLATVPENSQNNIYLIYGNYELFDNRSTNSPIYANFYGFNSYDKSTRLSSIQSDNGGSDLYPDYFILNYRLTTDNVVINGSHRYSNSMYTSFYPCDYWHANNCYIDGKVVLYQVSCKFTNCIFDGSNIKEYIESSSQWVSDYPLWIYNPRGIGTYEITDCKVIGSGKGVKIFWDGQYDEEVNVIFRNVDFECLSSPLEDKASIEADTTIFTGQLHVKYDSACDFGSFPGGKFNDKGTRSDFTPI